MNIRYPIYEGVYRILTFVLQRYDNSWFSIPFAVKIKRFLVYRQTFPLYLPLISFFSVPL